MSTLKVILSSGKGVWLFTPTMPMSSDRRCDAGKFGPTGLHHWDGSLNVCSCGSSNAPDPDTASHVRIQDVAAHHVIFDLPEGSLTWMNLRSQALRDSLLIETNLTAASSLIGSIRLLLEWAWLYDNGDEGLIPTVMASLRDALDLPVEIQAQALRHHPEMVGRYLRGGTARVSESGPLPSKILKTWIFAMRESAPPPTQKLT